MINIHCKYSHQKDEKQTQNKRTLRERPVAESAALGVVYGTYGSYGTYVTHKPLQRHLQGRF